MVLLTIFSVLLTDKSTYFKELLFPFFKIFYTLIVPYVINFVFSIGKQPYRDVINFVSYIQWRIQGGAGGLGPPPLESLRCSKLELFSKINKNMSYDVEFSKFLLNIL